MRVRVIEDISAHAVNNPGHLVTIDAGMVIDVTQEGDYLGQHTLYRFTHTDGKYIFMYEWEFDKA